jgi:hypothetical protein
MGTWGYFPLLRRPCREADHSPPCIGEVTSAWSYTSTTPYVFLAWCLVKTRHIYVFRSLAESSMWIMTILTNSQRISVSTVTRLWFLGPGFVSRQKKNFFLFSTVSKTAVEPTQSPMKWVLEVTVLGCEADHSPPSRAEVKNAWRYTSTSSYVFVARCFVKHRDNITFPLTLY